jgi:hypothetical protein
MSNKWEAQIRKILPNIGDYEEDAKAKTVSFTLSGYTAVSFGELARLTALLNADNAEVSAESERMKFEPDDSPILLIKFTGVTL